MLTVLKVVVVKLLKRYVLVMVSEKFLDWGLRKLARVAVASTKTKHDDEWLKKFEEGLDEQSNRK